MLAALLNLWRHRRWAVLGGGAVVLAVAIFGAVRLTRAAPRIPTADARLGEFVDYVQIRGEVKALKSIVLAAPAGAGDLLIVKLAKSGAQVQPGEIVAQFDSTQLKRQQEQRLTDVKTAEAEIERTRAQHRITEEQLQTDAEKAQYDVERAKLELSKAEILSKIEGEKARITLANAEQRVRELEERIKQNRAAAAAEVESRKQKRAKEMFDLQRVEQNLARLELKAPAAGMVTVMPNTRAGNWGSWPEFKEGDRAWSGAGLAELPDLSTLRITGRIEEADRGRVKLNQDAVIRVDALPDKEFTGRVADISPLAKPDFTGYPVRKNFDLALQIDQVDPRLRPGMSTTARVAVERLPNVIVIPAETSFVKSGKTVVYVLRGSKFEEREIEIARRGNGQLVIARGLKPGERVATKDPTLVEEDD
ncbi:MAG: efflux RND transporter periplasmic adaptor subunit [Acidobacteria bacterium]|nr:efflux RND transporter periplasmic adaptor subunit [Acidobacteriota bacterium]MBI3662624.1 efflux RND transporter periplasmic adaptor subunit [Acidobacteriota bacterium]